MKKLASIIYVFYILLSLLFVYNKTFANTARPGIWNTGAPIFTMLYLNDSLTLQMRRVCIYTFTRKDNLIATHYEHNESFPFETVIGKSDGLFFTKNDNLSRLLLDTLTYTETEIGNPYETRTTFFRALPMLLTLFVISAPVIIGIIIMAIIIWSIVKWVKIKKRKNKGT